MVRASQFRHSDISKMFLLQGAIWLVDPLLLWVLLCMPWLERRAQLVKTSIEVHLWPHVLQSSADSAVYFLDR